MNNVILNLALHQGASKLPYWMVNGQRVTRKTYESLEHIATRSDCFHTRISLRTGRVTQNKCVHVSGKDAVKSGVMI